MFYLKETLLFFAASNLIHKIHDRSEKLMALKVLVVGKLPHHSIYVSYMLQNLIEFLSYFLENIFSFFIIKFIITTWDTSTSTANFQTAMVSCSRWIWIINSSDHSRIWTSSLLHTKKSSNPLSHKYTISLPYASDRRRFWKGGFEGLRVFLWSLEPVIHINLKHNTIA